MDFSEDRAFLEQQDRDYRRAILSIIRGDSSDELMRSLLEDYHANDIASVLEELSEEENEKLLRVLGNEAMAEIVAYLDDASEIIEQMDADDAAETTTSTSLVSRLEAVTPFWKREKYLLLAGMS